MFKELPLSSLKIENVEIQAILEGGHPPSASVRFNLTSNNAFNLKDTPEHQRIRECLKRSELMLTSPLERILKRADLRNHVITYDEVQSWPKDERQQILDLELLRRLDDAQSIACDACGSPHDCGVDSETAAAALVRCPRLGVMQVRRDRLHCWEVNLERLASLVASAIRIETHGADDQVQASIQTVTPRRLWLVGRRPIGGRTAEFFLAQGSHWADGGDVLREAPRLGNSPAPIIFCPADSRKLPNGNIKDDRCFR